jgi:hypothetical protein
MKAEPDIPEASGPAAAWFAVEKLAAAKPVAA